MQPDNGLLEPYKVAMNTIFDYWRLRVEHIMIEIKRHDMFCGVYRGSYSLLKSAIDLTVHMTNIKLRVQPPRYCTCGPWSHNPAENPDGLFGGRKRGDGE